MSRRGSVARTCALVTLDVGGSLLTCAVAYRLRFEGVVVPGDLSATYRWLAGATSILWSLAAARGGLHARAATRMGPSNLSQSFEAALGVGVGLLLVNYAVLEGEISRGWIALVTFGLVLLGVSSREVVRRGRRALVPWGVGLERYILVGAGSDSRRLLDDLTRAAATPFRVVDVLSPELPAVTIAEVARSHRADGLIIPDGQLSVPVMARLATVLSGSGVDVLIAPGVSGLELRVTSVALLHGVPLLRAAAQAPRRRAVRARPTGAARRGVAILGTRGVPANYGGFETFAERLALDLTRRGLPVRVYCRSHYATAGRAWRGVSLVTLPTLRTKHFDTVVHTLISAIHLIVTSRIREVVLCNAANAPVVPLLRLFGRRVVLNVDGLEWRRRKWGVAGRAWYRLGEWLSVRTASVLVTDAREVQTYYRVRHDTDSVMIPYGADLLDRRHGRIPADLPVRPDGYALYVSRWEPENNPVMVASAHQRAADELDLVMLGEATYDSDIRADVAAAAGRNAHLAGPRYGDDYRGLQAKARCYVHATEVGGTHPALIEALAAGNICLVLDTPENREVVGAHGRLFSDEDGLVDALRWAARLDPAELRRRRSAAREYAQARFSWDAVCGQYHELLTGAPWCPADDFSP